MYESHYFPANVCMCIRTYYQLNMYMIGTARKHRYYPSMLYTSRKRKLSWLGWEPGLIARLNLCAIADYILTFLAQ